MKSLKGIPLLLALIFILAGCSFSSGNNASLKKILKNNPEADLFIVDNIVYLNATDVKWVNELTLKEDVLLGEIERTSVKENFTAWDATKIHINTEIYGVKERSDILLAKVGTEFIQYIKYIEG